MRFALFRPASYLDGKGEAPPVFPQLYFRKLCRPVAKLRLDLHWAYVLQITALTVCNFSCFIGKWGAVASAIATAVLEVGVTALAKFGRRKRGYFRVRLLRG